MSRTKKILLSIGLVALLLGGAAEILPPLLWGDAQAYPHAASIKTSDSYQDPRLLAKAWAQPVAALYRADIDYQRNASFCGPTTVVNVLHSLHQPGDQATILHDSGITTVLGYLPGGMTLDQVGALTAQTLNRKVTVLRGLTLEQFRAELRHVNDPARRYLINFSRRPLFDTGGGHHSPVAAYLEDEDLVLVLDVNKAYGPWLVSSERLYQAMNTQDPSSHKTRGMLLVQ